MAFKKLMSRHQKSAALTNMTYDLALANTIISAIQAVSSGLLNLIPTYPYPQSLNILNDVETKPMIIQLRKASNPDGIH